jgi:hypothetical protein
MFSLYNLNIDGIIIFRVKGLTMNPTKHQKNGRLDATFSRSMTIKYSYTQIHAQNKSE